jgi:hypothetical protein
MYLHEAMKESDNGEFLKVMQKEVSDQMEHCCFSIVQKDEVPQGSLILPEVWQMKQKYDI